MSQTPAAALTQAIAQALLPTILESLAGADAGPDLRRRMLKAIGGDAALALHDAGEAWMPEHLKERRDAVLAEVMTSEPVRDALARQAAAQMEVVEVVTRELGLKLGPALVEAQVKAVMESPLALDLRAAQAAVFSAFLSPFRGPAVPEAEPPADEPPAGA